MSIIEVPIAAPGSVEILPDDVLKPGYCRVVGKLLLPKALKSAVEWVRLGEEFKQMPRVLLPITNRLDDLMPDNAGDISVARVRYAPEHCEAAPMHRDNQNDYRMIVGLLGESALDVFDEDKRLIGSYNVSPGKGIIMNNGYGISGPYHSAHTSELESVALVYGRKLTS